MKALSSPILGVPSQSSVRIYGAFLDEPQRVWSISGLALQLPDVSVEAVRTMVYLMLDDRLLETVPHQRALTVKLTAAGRAILVEITEGWGPDWRAEIQP